MEKRRILIVLGHPVLRKAVNSSLCDEFKVIGSKSTPRELQESALKERPEIIISDLQFQDSHAIETIEELRAGGLDFAAIYLTASSDLETSPLSFGPRDGCILKCRAGVELCDAIKAALAGRSYFSEALKVAAAS